MNFYKSGGKHKTQKSLDKWTKQKWTTASGKKSSETGEVYAPKKTIESLKSTPSEDVNLLQQIERKEKLLQRVNNMLDMVYIRVSEEMLWMEGCLV